MTLDPEQSRSLLAAIVASSDDAIISKDLAGIITSWNKAAEGLFGYTAQEAIGQPVTILIPPERLAEEPRILERIRQGEQIRHYETVRQRKDGSRLRISLTVSPVVADDGRIIGASKIARDISREHALREALAASEERFRVTLYSIGDAVIATDAEGQVEFMNPVAEQLTGWKFTEARGRPSDHVFKIINEYTGRTVESPVARVLREGKAVGLANHTLLIARDGSERPIDDSGAAIRMSTGDVRGVVMVFRDVSERRAAEIAALRLAAIVENSDDAIVSKDLNGNITSWNKAAEQIFGYTAAEAIGQSIMMLIPWELRTEEEEILRRLRRGERVDHFRTKRVAKDKSILSVSITISPIKNQAGEIVGASKIARLLPP